MPAKSLLLPHCSSWLDIFRTNARYRCAVSRVLVPELHWRNVNPTDPLTPSAYLYDVHTVVSLSKISERAGKSKTSASGNASTMANRVKQRDGRQCWVTRNIYPTTNSHICPKRMGDHFLRIIYANFVQTPVPPTLSIYDEMCGITLMGNLDTPFDEYELGLRLVAPVRRPSLLFFYS